MSIPSSASLDSPVPASCFFVVEIDEPVEVMVRFTGWFSLRSRSGIWNWHNATNESGASTVQQPPVRALGDAIPRPSLCHPASLAIAARLQANTNTISNSASVVKERNLTNAAWQALAQGRCDVGVASFDQHGPWAIGLLRSWDLLKHISQCYSVRPPIQ